MGQGSPQIDAAFQKGYRALLDALHKAAPGAAFTLICPTPYDEITHGTEFPGYSRVIDKFADDVSAMGAELQASGDRTVLLADFHRPLTDAVGAREDAVSAACAAYRSGSHSSRRIRPLDHGRDAECPHGM